MDIIRIFLCAGSLLVSCLFFSCGNVSSDGSHSVRGSFYVQSTPLQGVLVSLEGQSIGRVVTQSDVNGEFQFPDIWDGEYVLTASKAGCVIMPGQVDVRVNKQDVTLSSFSVFQTWSSSIGGLQDERAYGIVSDGSGGYIIAGSTNSKGNGNCDGYAVHVNYNGETVWEYTFGGSNYDSFSAISRSNDGGYFLTGTTESSSNGGSDIWVVKIDADGNLVTGFGDNGQLRLGGSSSEWACAIITLPDSGDCVIAGSIENRADQPDQLSDMYIVQLNGTTGAKIWENYFGNTQWDYAYGICDSSDGNGRDGFVIVGSRKSQGGNTDISIMKIAPDLSHTLWEKTVDVGIVDAASSVTQLTGGDYAVAGYVTATNGATDIWAAVCPREGGTEKSIQFGGTHDDQGCAVIALSDGGFAVAGYTTSTALGRGDTDYYLARLSYNGNVPKVEWERSLDRGIVMNEYCYCLIGAFDGGFALAGYAYSAASKNDIWVLKTDSNGLLESENK